MNFFRFLDLCTNVQHLQNPDLVGLKIVKDHGIHYSIDGSRESILMMAEEYEVFVERLADSRDMAVVSITPVDSIVSF